MTNVGSRPSGTPTAGLAEAQHLGVCPHDRPDTCSMAITVRNGRAVHLHGVNCNVLASDSLSDTGGGATFHTNLVQIERS